MTIASNPPNERINTPQPTIEQNLHTAANELPKLAMGVVAHDVLVPFQDVGKHNVWQYETSSGHPALPPMGNLRASNAEISPNESWKGVASQLTEALPEPIQAMLGLLRALSAESRNNESFENYEMWAALDQTVTFAAKTIVHFTLASEIMNSESAKNEALLNSELPSIVSKNMAEEAQEMAKLMKEELKKRENDPSYDATNYLISQFEPLVMRLSEEITEPQHE